jgi:hypothetical protein
MLAAEAARRWVQRLVRLGQAAQAEAAQAERNPKETATQLQDR